MKTMAVVVVLALVLGLAVSCQAQVTDDAAKKAAQEAVSVEKVVPVDRNNDSIVDGNDVYNSEGKLTQKEYDDNQDGVMERFESYDPNTGMPDVVPSDKGVDFE